MCGSGAIASSVEQSRIREHRLVTRLRAQLEDVGASRDSFAASVSVLHHGRPVDSWAMGWTAKPRESPRIQAKTRFLVASLTKPVAVAAVMRLIEITDLELTTPVSSVLAEFTGHGKQDIEVWHLMTHTSGLPDMVDDNLRIRQRHGQLREFFASICGTDLRFSAGSGVGYQSMGFLVLSTLVERVSGRAFPEFLSEQILEPAGMTDTVLTLPRDAHDIGVRVNLPAGQLGTDWHWNSRYWRQLGAPWGGLQSTSGDMAAFAHLFVSGGLSVTGRRVLSERTVHDMSTDWTSGISAGLPSLGLGWFVRGNSPQVSVRVESEPADATGVSTPADVVFERGFFGSAFAESAVGHSGVTGCAMWADSTTGVAASLLTNSPSSIDSDGVVQTAAELIGQIGLDANGRERKETCAVDVPEDQGP